MNLQATIGAAALVLIGGGALIGYRGYRRADLKAERAYRQVLSGPKLVQRRFDPRQVQGLPEVAQRYFRHAVAPGTPIYSTVEVQMEGTFLLGDKEKFKTYEMTARQALRPSNQFIWIPRLRSGPITITGSDALVAGDAWTRFWILRLVPVANVQTSPDLVRSAQFRAALEGALWLPFTLLPGNGVEWQQTGRDEARVVLKRFKPEPIMLTLRLGPEGAVREVVGQRWSNVNPEKRFRLQPFGGVIRGETTFQGLTIPTDVAVGNNYGIEDYLPFFQAKIASAKYS